MFRIPSAAFRLPSPAGASPGAVRPPVRLTATRLGVVAVALAVVPFEQSFPGPGARGVAVTVAFYVAVATWLIWLLGAWLGWRRGINSRPVFVGGLITLGAAGGVMAGLSGITSGFAIGCVATSTAGVMLAPETSLAITAETVAAYIVSGLAAGASAGMLVGYPLGFFGFWAFGLTRHAYVLRAQQAEVALEQERRAHEAETQAAALAERTRIAREIHDVLAHSLGAVSVNLQAAEGLLSGLPDSPELTKALECVERASAHTRDGLVEARRAVRTLRDPAAASPPQPVAGQLARLVTEFRESGDAPATLDVRGTERAVGTETGLSLYRAAQETLTNARKHAPGQPVTLTLEFAPDAVELRAVNPLPESSSRAGASGTGASGTDASGAGAFGTGASGTGALAASGGGHGLTGLRERAALAEGTLTAGPADGQWQVCLRIPA